MEIELEIYRYIKDIILFLKISFTCPCRKDVGDVFESFIFIEGIEGKFLSIIYYLMRY